MTGPFVVGQWQVTPDDLTVRDSSQHHRLRPKDMAVLQVLAASAPNVVTRTTLIDAVWPRGFVDPAVLNNAVSRLRKVLKNGQQEIIETIPRQGYRLLLPVSLEDLTGLTPWSHGSPYRGLQPFTDDQARVFFGRNREIKTVLRALTEQSEVGRSFLLVLGPSGSGKTSLIQAGVIPALLRASASPLSANWHVEHFVASSTHSIWMSLAAILNRGMAALVKDHERVNPITDKDLQNSSHVTLEYVVQHLSRTQPEPNRILLVMDHLEQILVGYELSELQEFFTVVHEMARLGVIWIVAALRSDFYEDYNKIAALTALKRQSGQVDLSPPDAEQIGSIIREPALAAGLGFEDANGRTLDNVLQASAMTQVDVLPMLQFTLEELYNRRTEQGVLTFKALESIGGIEGSLAQRAEMVFTNLDQEAKRELPVVLNAIVRLSGHRSLRPARRFARMDELTQSSSRQRLVDAYIDSRLFVSGLDGEHAVVSVVHEALFEHWERAQRLLAENHDLLLLRKQLSEASEIWERHDRSNEFLLGIGPLEEYQHLLRKDEIQLTKPETALIEASKSKTDQANNLRRIAIASLAAFALTAVAAAGIAMVKRSEAHRETQRASQVTEFLVDLFELANPGQASRSAPTAKQVLDLGAQHLAGQLNQQPQVRATLLHTMGRVYMKLGAYDQAESLLGEAYELRRDLESDTTEQVESLNELGKVNYHKGNYDTAQSFYSDALELIKLGGLLNTAIHTDTLNHQGENFAALADYEKAISHHRQAYELRASLFGPHHEKTGSSLQNLAGALRRNGKLEAAESHYREALSIHEAAYGSTHHEVAVVLSNLGLLLTDSERLDEAQPLLERALDIRREVFGNSHPHTANSLHNLSALLFRAGDYNQAEPIFRESLQLHESLFGENHDSVAYGRNNLATLLLETDRSDEAQTLYAKAHTTLSQRLGDSHPNTALIQSNLAKASLANGDAENALFHAKHAVQILEQKLPPDHWRIGVIKATYGAALAAHGETDVAETELLQSLELLTHSHGTEAKTTQRTIEHLIKLYEQTNDVKQQQALIQKRVNTSN